MSAFTPILEQLQLDSTFFIQFGIFFVLFLMLGPIFFSPFQKMIDARHEGTTGDKSAAEALAKEARDKLEEYQRSIAQGRTSLRDSLNKAIESSKREESTFLTAARDEARKVTTQAVESIASQQNDLRKKLDFEIESLAFSISEKLLSRKV